MFYYKGDRVWIKICGLEVSGSIVTVKQSFFGTKYLIKPDGTNSKLIWRRAYRMTEQ